MVIIMNKLQSYRLLLDVGYGMNTKFELLALWGLLLFAILKNLLALQVRGDSKEINDWALGKHDIHSIIMMHWLRRTKDLFRFFSFLSFQHVYREYNVLADELSKKAIGLGSKVIHSQKYTKGYMTDSGMIELL